MTYVSALHFHEARKEVIERVRSAGLTPPVEEVSLAEAFGRVLAADARSDRDYPPVARSVRDGFALRAQDLPGELEVIGEVRAGEASGLAVGPGQAIEIMTGAPVPAGADAIVMVEHVSREGARIRTQRTQKPGDFINPRGAEAKTGEVVVARGSRLGFPQVAMLATIGCTHVQVYRKPDVAILATGDEIVQVSDTPKEFQIRNSNAWSLACQVRRAGGCPRILPVARDQYPHTLELVEQGLASDLLLLSGGVSAGKYDIVEKVLADLDAEFFFTRVLIQPGQPLVFGRRQARFFFGLPGNPASTMVTFELFARAALDLLGGCADAPIPLAWARLTREFRHKTGLTRFLPARLDADGLSVTPVRWQGSGDVPALARANAFLVAAADREFWQAGEMIPVLLQ